MQNAMKSQYNDSRRIRDPFRCPPKETREMKEIDPRPAQQPTAASTLISAQIQDFLNSPDWKNAHNRQVLR